MTHEEIVQVLLSLGFNSGWTLSGTDLENMVWENDAPKPTLEQLRTALENGNE